MFRSWVRVPLKALKFYIMKDYTVGVILFILFGGIISYFSPLNFLESFGVIFALVLGYYAYTELKK